MNHKDREDYYVYLHRRKDNNEIFYVGHGRKYRSAQYCNRNSDWRLIVEEAGGFNIEYVKFNLNYNNSHLLELEQFELYKDTLVNCKTPKDETLDYSSVDWNNILYYNEDSPTHLSWKIPNGSRNPTTRRIPGDQAGCLRKVNNKLVHGQIKLKGKNYAIHRVVWILCKGAIPNGLVINHIDHDPTNNNISNLELCTMSENSRKSLEHRGN